MLKRYRLSLLIATLLLLTGCGGELSLPFGNPTPTPIPFARYDSENVLLAFAAAHLEANNPTPQVTGGRDAPGDFGELVLFEIPSIAPAGGQIIVFETAEQLAAWQAYIERLRSNSETRRSVVYVYVQDNVMLQLSSLLTNEVAAAYREAFERMRK